MVSAFLSFAGGAAKGAEEQLDAISKRNARDREIRRKETMAQFTAEAQNYQKNKGARAAKVRDIQALSGITGVSAEAALQAYNGSGGNLVAAQKLLTDSKTTITGESSATAESLFPAVDKPTFASDAPERRTGVAGALFGGGFTQEDASGIRGQVSNAFGLTEFNTTPTTLSKVADVGEARQGMNEAASVTGDAGASAPAAAFGGVQVRAGSKQPKINEKLIGDQITAGILGELSVQIAQDPAFSMTESVDIADMLKNETGAPYMRTLSQSGLGMYKRFLTTSENQEEAARRTNLYVKSMTSALPLSTSRTLRDGTPEEQEALVNKAIPQTVRALSSVTTPSSNPIAYVDTLSDAWNFVAANAGTGETGTEMGSKIVTQTTQQFLLKLRDGAKFSEDFDIAGATQLYLASFANKTIGGRSMFEMASAAIEADILTRKTEEDTKKTKKPEDAITDPGKVTGVDRPDEIITETLEEPSQFVDKSIQDFGKLADDFSAKLDSGDRASLGSARRKLRNARLKLSKSTEGMTEEARSDFNAQIEEATPASISTSFMKEFKESEARFARAPSSTNERKMQSDWGILTDREKRLVSEGANEEDTLVFEKLKEKEQKILKSNKPASGDSRSLAAVLRGTDQITQDLLSAVESVSTIASDLDEGRTIFGVSDISLEDYISENEGTTFARIKDSKGIDTIGTGLNLEGVMAEPALKAAGLTKSEIKATMLGSKRLSKEQVEKAFAFTLDVAETDAKSLYPNYEDLPENVQKVLTDLSFNLGKTRLSKFSGLAKAIEAGDFKRAALELTFVDPDAEDKKITKYLKDVRNRGKRNAKVLLLESLK